MPCSKLLAVLLVALLLPASAGAEAPRLDSARVEALAALPVLHGDAVSVEGLAGKAVVVAFFASWCPPCHPEFDNLARAQATFGADLAIVAVNIFEVWGQFTGTVRRDAFLARKVPPFSVLGDGEAVADLFAGVTRIPTVLVFAPDGRPVEHFIHLEGASRTHLSYEEIAAAIRRALQG